MMANWDVSGVMAPFERASLRLHQLVGLNDRAVPPEDAEALARRYNGASLDRLPGLGHLAHEEDAARVAASIFSAFASAELPARKSGT